MAEILRGNDKGRQCVLHQWCNDWFTVDIDGGEQGKVVSPTSLRLTADEVDAVRKSAEADQVGVMFELFVLADDGTFARRKTMSDLRRERGWGAS